MQQGLRPERLPLVVNEFGVNRPITRRGWLGLLPGFVSAAVVSQKSQPLPQAGEFVRFADPTTEVPVVRLTTPAYNDVLPAPDRGFVSLKPRMLYCSSDRAGGRMAPFQIDLRTGAIRQVAEAGALDTNSLSLDAQGRFLFFIDSGRLCQVAVNSKHDVKKPETLAEDVSAYALGSSRNELFALRAGRLLQLLERGENLLAEDAITPCVMRPGGRGCLFGRKSSADEHEFWYASVAGSGARPVLLASGRVGNPFWSADGSSLLFLRDVPVNNVFVAELREVNPEERIERCVAATSQFAAFSPNRNDSVFVGASKSKAQPNIVLLLRNPHREMTLCEHHASNPASARPVFSPDSRRVYFQSDREGKSAIYSVNVEQLVEPT